MIPHISYTSTRTPGGCISTAGWWNGLGGGEVTPPALSGAWRYVRIARDRVLQSGRAHAARDPVGVRDRDLDCEVRSVTAQVDRRQGDAQDAPQYGRIAGDDHSDRVDRHAGDAVAGRRRARWRRIDERHAAAGRTGLCFDMNGNSRHVQAGWRNSAAVGHVDVAAAVLQPDRLVWRVDGVEADHAGKGGSRDEVSLPACWAVEMDRAGGVSRAPTCRHI